MFFFLWRKGPRKTKCPGTSQVSHVALAMQTTQEHGGRIGESGVWGGGLLITPIPPTAVRFHSSPIPIL